MIYVVYNKFNKLVNYKNIKIKYSHTSRRRDPDVGRCTIFNNS